MFVSLLIVWRGVGGGTVSGSTKQESVLSAVLLNFKEEMLSKPAEQETQLVTIFNVGSIIKVCFFIISIQFSLLKELSNPV